MGKTRFGAAITNWRLVLLATTALVLSIASGWTTWDGMRNFTREPLLSLMITFGIQGVMLIVAWLIGESFATGMGRRKSPKAETKTTTKTSRVSLFAGIGIILLGSLSIWLLGHFSVFSGSWTSASGKYSWLAVAILVFALLVMSAGRDVVDSYLLSLRVIVRNAALWVMFLACMATSVFFSFDSLFSTIFPKAERVRAADLRARSAVANINNDIIALNAKRRLEQRTRFLAGREWQNYTGVLDRLAGQLQKAPASIDRYLQEENAKDQDISAGRQAKLALIEAKKAQAAARKGKISGRVGQLQRQAARLAVTLDKLKLAVFKKDREIIAKTGEMEAEEHGIGETLKAGRGPIYRKLATQRLRLVAAKKAIELQHGVYARQLRTTEAEIERQQRQGIAAEAELLQWRGKAQSAGSATAIEKSAHSTGLLRPKIQAALQQLIKDRIAFEQHPTRKRLDALQSRCSMSIDLMRAAPTELTRLHARACDPGKLHEAAASLYALDRGAIASRTLCTTGVSKSGGDAKAQGRAGIDSQLARARRCLQGAGLSHADALVMGSAIDALERNRDDKANRFVVTINAFYDGNRLAYLALAIAVAIDALVFISGLFGANVLRSPLSAIPQDEERTARHLDAMIENALLPDVYDNATMALEAARPVAVSPQAMAADRSPASFWSHEINLADVPEMSRASLRKILNSGAIIGAVKRDPARQQQYFLRGELIEFLNDAAMRAFAGVEGGSSLAQLRKVIAAALCPEVSRHVATVLGYLHPSTAEPGFSSQIIMSEVMPEDGEVVRQCLNAASTRDAIKCISSEGENDRVLIGKDFYRVLIAMSQGLAEKAEAPLHGQLPATKTKAVKHQAVASEPAQAKPQAKPTEPAPGKRSSRAKVLISDDTSKFD